MDGQGFSGAWLARSGGQQVTRVSGLADRAGRPWTLGTRSQVASISKQVVALCALVLTERGVLDLDLPVGRFLPAGGRGWDEVAVRALLTHTSGLGHWGDRPGFRPDPPLPPEQRLPLLLAAPRSGTAFTYSSPGYVVLAAVLEAAAGRPYPQLARECVLAPLRLTETHVGAGAPGPLALGHRGGKPVTPWDLASIPGTGDVWSTVGDVAELVRAVHSGELLSGPARDLVGVVDLPGPGDPADRVRTTGYGAGHFVGTVDGQRAYLHPGDNPGYQSLAVWLPDPPTVVVVLSNDEADDVVAVALEALAAVRER